jgi:hypothetical protein
MTCADGAVLLRIFFLSEQIAVSELTVMIE